MNRDFPLLDVVITARPSWARVKNLVYEYAKATSNSNVRVKLVGPAVSTRYGDLRDQLPTWLSVKSFPALHDTDALSDVARSCLDGARALTYEWTENPPDCSLVIADRTETAGVALVSALMQIPLIHLQGGEISGSIDDKIRDTNSKLADLHLTTNEFTRNRLVSIGEDPSRIHIVGCPSIDLVKDVIKKSGEIAQPWNQDLGGVGKQFSLEDPFGIVMFHPDTLSSSQNSFWINEITQVLKNSEINWFWFWPNPDHGNSGISKAIRITRELGELSKVRFLINLPPEIFISLASRASLMIGNSSFGIREASYLGLPVINLGERQNGRQKSSNVFDLNSNSKTMDFSKLICDILKEKRWFSSSELYGNGDAGFRAARIIKDWKPSVKSRLNSEHGV